MRFTEWLILEKYMTDESAFCGYCKKPLVATSISVNPNEKSPGQLMQCDCKKSKIWTNKIRNVDNLLRFTSGQIPKYTNGFCNDKWCAYCFTWPASIDCVKTGVPKAILKHRRDLDQYACRNCDQNNLLYMDTSLEGSELDTKPILDWYKNHLIELKRVLGQT